MENKTVADLSSRLSQAILESDEYKNYRYYHDELKKNPSMFDAMNELRKVNFELQNAEGIDNMYDEVVRVFEQTQYMRNNLVASRYMRAEMSLSRMIQEMIDIIFNDIDFDVSFFEE